MHVFAENIFFGWAWNIRLGLLSLSSRGDLQAVFVITRRPSSRRGICFPDFTQYRMCARTAWRSFVHWAFQLPQSKGAPPGQDLRTSAARTDSISCAMAIYRHWIDSPDCPYQDNRSDANEHEAPDYRQLSRGRVKEASYGVISQITPQP
jgi:hypothetical protein